MGDGPPSSLLAEEEAVEKGAELHSQQESRPVQVLPMEAALSLSSPLPVKWVALVHSMETLKWVGHS